MKKIQSLKWPWKCGEMKLYWKLKKTERNLEENSCEKAILKEASITTFREEEVALFLRRNVREMTKWRSYSEKADWRRREEKALYLRESRRESYNLSLLKKKKAIWKKLYSMDSVSVRSWPFSLAEEKPPHYSTWWRLKMTEKREIGLFSQSEKTQPKSVQREKPVLSMWPSEAWLNPEIFIRK